MRKLSLLTAILLLASAWVLAQSSTSPSSQQYPSSSPSSSQSAGQEAQQSASQAKEGATSVQGCLGGSAGAYTLTDNSGKTYQLAGDTSKLADHVGHEMKITGTAASAGGAAAAGAAGATPTLTVKSAKMVSATCPSK